MLLLPAGAILAQKSVSIDSLRNEFAKATTDKQRLNILYELGTTQQRNKNFDQAIGYFNQAIKINETADNKKNIATLNSNLGACYFGKKDAANALQYYFKAAGYFEDTDNKKNLLVVYSNIASVYNEMGNQSKSIEFYEKSITLNEALGNQQNVATLSANIGGIFRSQNNFPRATEYILKALRINESIGNLKAAALNANSLGSIYFNQGNYDSAIEFYSKSEKAYEQAGNRESAARNVGNIATVYLKIAQQAGSETEKQQALRNAIEKFELAIPRVDAEVSQQLSASLATAQSMLPSTPVASSRRSSKDDVASSGQDVVESRGRDNQQNTELRTEYTRKQDSLSVASRNKELNLRKEMDLQKLTYEYERKQAMAKTEEERELLRQEEAQKRAQIENDYRTLLEAASLKEKLAQSELEKQEALASAEIQKQKKIKHLAIGIGALIFIIAFFMYRNFRNQRKANKIILEEKQRSEALLLNILPQEVADELKKDGKSAARLYNEVSVLFTDFVNFTQTSETLSPQELVNELHACFSAFDSIIERNGLEKIKTIGDAYMAVCGLPENSPDHAQRAVRAALEIRDFIHERKKNEGAFDVRIGINSGQVVAGIVGVKKFAYDIWGDAVNTAARLESSGELGKVNISESTYNLVKDDFSFISRGKISAKNKGEIAMFFVEYSNTDIASEMVRDK
jgi:adenylate cyclase